MLQQPAVQFFLRKGDWIQLVFEEYSLYSSGFKTSEVDMRVKEHPLNCIFVIESANPENKGLKGCLQFSQPFYLKHYLSGRYLCYNQHFATKSELFLRNLLNQNCQFSAKPLYKCQILKHSNIRNGEQCCLTPGSGLYSNQKVGLVVGKEKGNSQCLNIALKKNEQSPLRFVRRNQLHQKIVGLYTLQIYQLKHNEVKSCLAASNKEIKGEVTLTSEKNNQTSYLVIQKRGVENREEISISQQCEVSIRFYGCKRYLGFSQSGHIFTAEQLNIGCFFRLEMYTDQVLQPGSPLKIRHIQSNKYLSIIQNQPSLQRFSPFNTWQFVAVAQGELVDSLFLSDTFKGLSEIVSSVDPIANNRRKIRSILKQSINFCYRNSKIYEQFQKLEKVSSVLKWDEQLLFSRIGYLPLLYKLCQKIVDEVREDQKLVFGYYDQSGKESKEFKDRYADKEEIFVQALLLICAICQDNQHNLSLFCGEIRSFFEFIGVLKGPCELLFQLFGFNSIALDMLETTQFSFKNKTLKGLEVMLEYLAAKEFAVSQKVKVVRLLRSLIQTEGGHTILSHQHILLSYLQQNKLSKILLILTKTQSDQLQIEINKRQNIQLVQLLSSNYEQQIKLLSEQLRLMVGLCRTGSQKHISLFRQVVSEGMIKRYLKEDLEAEFLAIFMEILIEIYLSQPNKRKNHSLIVVTKSNNPGQQILKVNKSGSSPLKSRLLQHQYELQDINMVDKTRFLIDLDSLKKIKTLILSQLSRDLQSKHLEQDVIVYLLALQKFVELQICSEQELKDVLKMLTKAMQTCLESGVEINQKFMMEYLRLVEYDLDKNLERAGTNLLKKIKLSYNPEYSRGESARDVVRITNQFIAEAVIPLAVGQTATTLELTIIACLAPQKSEIFLKAAHLYERMVNIGVYFIDKIQKSIPIESQESFQLLQRANLLLAKLTKAVSEALYSRKSEQQLSGKRNMLNVLQQICQMLTSGENSEGNINILAQKIVCQLCFIERVTDYLCQKKEQLRNPQNNALFSKIFSFIGLLLSNSDENFQLNEDNLNKLKVIYKYIDRGQIKLLYQITKSSVAVKRKYSFLMQSWISAVNSCFLPRIQVPLGLSLLLDSWTRAQQKVKYASELAQIILNNGEFLSNLLKIQRPGQYLSLQVVKRCDYREQWVFYIMVVLRLLKQILQSTTDIKQRLKQFLIQYLPLRMLLNLLQQSFKLQITQSNSSLLLVLLLKQIRKQLMQLILHLYQQDLRQQDMKLILTYLHKIKSFLSVKYIGESNNEAVVNMLLYQHNRKTTGQQQMELREMLVTYICMEHSSHQITAGLINTINNPFYLFINHYYHFCFTLYDIIKTHYTQDQNTTQFQDSPLKDHDFSRQLEYFMKSLVNQYKQVVNEKLPYVQFANNSPAYTSAVKSAEEIIKQSIEFKYKMCELQDEVVLLQGQQFFEHKELKFLLDSFLGARHKIQKHLYQAILIMLYNRKIELTTTYQNKQYAEHTHSIVKFIISKLTDNKAHDQDFLSYCWVLAAFLQNGTKAIQWQPHLEFQEVMVRLSKAKEDRSNRILAVWLQTEYKLMQNYLERRPTLAEKYRKHKVNHGDAFEVNFMAVKDRLKAIIQQERELYDSKKLLDQANNYFQQRRLNNTLTTYKLSTELILRWLQLKLRYSLQNTERYFDLLMQVVLLLKTYSRFIADFDSKYISQELQSKLTMALRIIFYAVTAGNLKVLMMLLEYQIWDDINLVLKLDDSLERQLLQQNANAYELIKMLTREKLGQLPACYIQGVLQIYNNSVAVYGEQEDAIMAVGYPLVPAKAYYQKLKTHAISILQEFRHNHSAAIQLFSKLDLKAVQKNVINTYDKYDYLFQKYTIAVIYPQVEYVNRDNEMVAEHMGFENAVILSGLKLQIDRLNGKMQLEQKYAQIRKSLSKQNLQSYLSLFKSFFTDLVLLLFGCCIRCFKLKPTHQLTYEQILMFFLMRLGRVELQWGDRIYSQEFMVYPECRLGWRIKKDCLKELNFASNQLKRESIITSMNIFILQYQNELNFQTTLWKMGAVRFLSQYMRIFRLLCFTLVLILNILLVTDAAQSFSFDGFDVGYPFEILTAITTLLVLSMLIVQLIRKIPLSVKLNRYNLQQGIGFLSRGYNSMSIFQQNLIILIKIVVQFEVVYKVVYTGITCLALYNKLFAALLMLDLMFRIPATKTLIAAIWKPRYKVLLVIVAFIIMQYFFSILLYFFFRGSVNGYCDTLGHCFTFVFATSYRAINGFVGYLFNENYVQGAVIDISIFGIFEDIYAIVIHLIMVAVMLAVVINSFVMTKAEDSRQKEALSSACIICNIDRSRFNLQNRSNFKSHKSVRHNLFNYFDFKYRLNNKHDLLSDLECWVQQCKSNDWMPDGRARELENQDEIVHADAIY